MPRRRGPVGLVVDDQHRVRRDWRAGRSCRRRRARVLSPELAHDRDFGARAVREQRSEHPIAEDGVDCRQRLPPVGLAPGGAGAVEIARARRPAARPPASRAASAAGGAWRGRAGWRRMAPPPRRAPASGPTPPARCLPRSRADAPDGDSGRGSAGGAAGVSNSSAGNGPATGAAATSSPAAAAASGILVTR